MSQQVVCRAFQAASFTSRHCSSDAFLPDAISQPDCHNPGIALRLEVLHSAMPHPTLLLHSYPQVSLLCAVTQQSVSSSRQHIACSCMSWLSLQLQRIFRCRCQPVRAHGHARSKPRCIGPAHCHQLQLLSRHCAFLRILVLGGEGCLAQENLVLTAERFNSQPHLGIVGPVRLAYLQ